LSISADFRTFLAKRKELLPKEIFSSSHFRRALLLAMTHREICKYYLHGACRNGAACRFSHAMDAPKSTVCTYFLAGNCTFGDKCRYDHVRPDHKRVRDTPHNPRDQTRRLCNPPSSSRSTNSTFFAPPTAVVSRLSPSPQRLVLTLQKKRIFT
jgi:hypothetical protein